MEEMQEDKKPMKIKDALKKCSDILKKHINKIRRYYDRLTTQGLIKFVLFLVAIHLLIGFVRPLPIAFSSRPTRSRVSYRVPQTSGRVQTPSRTINTRVRRP